MILTFNTRTTREELEQMRKNLQQAMLEAERNQLSAKRFTFVPPDQPLLPDIDPVAYQRQLRAEWDE
jgi:hypothetical protein